MDAPSIVSLSEQLTATLSRFATDSHTPSRSDLAKLNVLASTMHQLILCDARNAADAATQARLQLDLLRSEINSELVDREANAARIVERQQFLFQRSSALIGQSSAADRACASALYVEAALASLCPHVNTPMSGCTVLESQNGGR